MMGPITQPVRLKLTVESFVILHAAGSFDALSKVELLDGDLYTMGPQTSAHVVAKSELAFRLHAALKTMGSAYSVLIEPTVSVPPASMPEPDIAITSIAKVGDYYPPEAIRLVVEVAYTSQANDLGFKKALYASAGIPEYWVLDVEAQRIHLFWSPAGEDYAQTRIIPVGGAVSSETLAGLTVETDGLA